MIRLTLVAVFACALLCGCSLFSGGTDPEVERTRTEARAAIDEAKAAKKTLDETRTRYAKGEATREELQAAQDAFEAKADDADKKIEALDAAIKIAAERQSDLGSWGSKIGGIFGPVGAAIGGVAGTIAAAFMAWRKTKALKGVLTGIQAAREELHKTDPIALAKSDEAMKKAIPKELQAVIEVLKRKYNLKITR